MHVFGTRVLEVNHGEHMGGVSSDAHVLDEGGR